MTDVAIVDYGMGNLRSVEKALEHIGVGAVRTSQHDRLRDADGLILPGVGALPEAMRRLREQGLDELVRERVAEGTPLLGICLGMQLLFDSSSENEGAEGLGLLRGRVEPLRAGGLKVPHIGWSPLRWERESPLAQALADETPFYFVHSFDPRPSEDEDLLGTAEYGERFAAAVARPPVFGVQFHPEKSSAAGLRLLENFAGICAGVTVPA